MTDTTTTNRGVNVTPKTSVTVLFAGDSGDGMQLTGTQFANTVAVYGSDLNTFPNFPSEIRAPAGTISGVSGFQMQFGSQSVYTPGAKFDVLIAMNAAALKANLSKLHHGGIIIADTDGFDDKNLRLSGYGEGNNPLEDGTVADYTLFNVPVVSLTRKALADTGLSVKNIDRCKNMFILGILYWLYSLPIDTTIKTLQVKFKNKADIADANIKAVTAGYNFGDETEMLPSSAVSRLHRQANSQAPTAGSPVTRLLQ